MAKFRKGDRVRFVGTMAYGAMVTKDMILVVEGTREGVTTLAEYCSGRTWKWPASGVGLRLCKPNKAYMRVFAYNGEQVDRIEREENLTKWRQLETWPRAAA